MYWNDHRQLREIVRGLVGAVAEKTVVAGGVVVFGYASKECIAVVVGADIAVVALGVVGRVLTLAVDAGVVGAANVVVAICVESAFGS